MIIEIYITIVCIIFCRYICNPATARPISFIFCSYYAAHVLQNTTQHNTTRTLSQCTHFQRRSIHNIRHNVVVFFQFVILVKMKNEYSSHRNQFHIFLFTAFRSRLFLILRYWFGARVHSFFESQSRYLFWISLFKHFLNLFFILTKDQRQKHSHQRPFLLFYFDQIDAVCLGQQDHW